MIVTSTTESVAFTPSWLEGRKDAPVFRLRAGDVIERGQMEAELSGKYQAGKVWDFELRQAAIGGVTELLREDAAERDRALELINAELEFEIDRARAVTTGDKGPEDPLSADDRRQLVEIRKILEEHWPDYRDLLAQQARRREIAPIVALQRFCTGWENCRSEAGEPVPFERSADGRVKGSAIAALSSLEMIAAGNRAYGLQYGHGERKNSLRPSTSEDGQLNSSSDDSSKADGKSAGKGGKKTPASPSRRGSGRS